MAGTRYDMILFGCMIARTSSGVGCNIIPVALFFLSARVFTDGGTRGIMILRYDERRVF